MLLEMMKVSGMFSPCFSTTGKYATRHFDANGNFINATGNFRVDSVSNAVLSMGTFVPPPRPMRELLQDAASHHAPSHPMVLHHFADLVLGCLKPDPSARLTPQLALQHSLHTSS